jgi:hypothetical protein
MNTGEGTNKSQGPHVQASARTRRMTQDKQWALSGLTDHLWSLEDLVALWEAYEQRIAERAA